MKISTFTTATNPELRNDPYLEAIKCYESFSDEVITVGSNWPVEFTFSDIGKFFQEGFDKSTGDWVFRMDVDYFFHEDSIGILKNSLKKFSNYPAVAFPQYQFFTPDRYQIKTRLCVALNKKRFPNILLNGGGDLCLPTLNGVVLDHLTVPSVNIPIFQYDSIFRTKEIIANDRARFARAWFREFNNFGDRGGSEPEIAYEKWFETIKNKYPFHTHKINIDKHPIFIKDKLKNLQIEQFGFSAFGLQDNIQYPLKNYLKGYKEKYYNSLYLKLQRNSKFLQDGSQKYQH